MKKKILIELRSAINASDYFYGKDYIDSRIDDYVAGLKCFFKKLSHNKNFDCIFVENTIENKDDLPQQILDVIPEGTFLHVKNKNNYGRINKGAGDIEMWKDYLDKISEYEYFFHYEPRMILDDATFIQSFLDNPRNCFCVEDNTPFFKGTVNQIRCVKTGYFGVKVSDFIEYCNGVDLDKFVNIGGDGVNIENDIRTFFENKNTDFQKDVKYCIRRWYDSYGNSGYGKY